MAAKYHMRLAAQAIGDLSNPIIPLGQDVCIDIILRGKDKNDIELVAISLRDFLDVKVSGNWAGIGRGDFVDNDITLA